MTGRSSRYAFVVVVLALACDVLAISSFGNPPPTLQMPANVSSLSFRLTNAFNVPVTSPLAIATPPAETNRLFIVERAGRIVVITNLAAPNRSVFLDMTGNVRGLSFEGGLLGLAFHPGH